MIFGNPPIVTNGLVLHLDAGSRKSYVGSGTAWSDLSGNNNSGSLVNTPTFNTANQGCLTFNGTSQLANLPNSATLQPTVFTISAHVYPSIFNSNQRTIFSSYSQSPNVAGMALQIAGNNQIRVFVGNNTGVTNGTNYRDLLNTGVQVPVNTWSHITATYDGATIRTYYNTVLNSTLGWAGGTAYAAANTASISAVVGAGWFQGLISDVQLYNRALSATEITQNYNTFKTRFGLV
jgi:hypothetical protein